MLNLNKLILVESEMKGPKGHFLDNLIETTKTFEKKLNISWLLNEQFDNEGTYIPVILKFLNVYLATFLTEKKIKFYI